jgi:2-amino-4-hydroxy-6-hydroxymethyldihydropteridine diphosphokinase
MTNTPHQDYTIHHSVPLNSTILALGSNKASVIGEPYVTVKCALGLLASRGVDIISVSRFYASAPTGRVRQARYINAVAAVDTRLPLRQILAVAKQIERDLGRRTGVRWGPRPLDIDVISHRGQFASGHSLGWVGRASRPTSKRRGQIALPHPEAHRRIFVLQPLCDILPQWWHPVLKCQARQLLNRLPPKQRVGFKRVNAEAI